MKLFTLGNQRSSSPPKGPSPIDHLALELGLGDSQPLYAYVHTEALNATAADRVYIELSLSIGYLDEAKDIQISLGNYTYTVTFSACPWGNATLGIWLADTGQEPEILSGGSYDPTTRSFIAPVLAQGPTQDTNATGGLFAVMLYWSDVNIRRFQIKGYYADRTGPLESLFFPSF